MANVANLYASNISTSAIAPDFYNLNTTITSSGSNTNWATIQPANFVPMEAPKPHKLSAREWLQNRIDEMCAVGHDALTCAA